MALTLFFVPVRFRTLSESETAVSDSDAAVSSRTGAGVGTGAAVGCFVGFGFLVRFPLTTAHKRQRVRCRRMAE